MADLTIDELKTHYLDEGDSAYIYNVLAGFAKTRQMYGIFVQLRDKELEHQKKFKALLLKRNAPIPIYKPSFRIRLMEFFAGRGATSLILKLRIADESQEVSQYILSSSKNKTAGSIAKDEIAHSKVLKELQSSPSQEIWHHNETGAIIRNAIYGFNDGLTANFGLIMGVIGTAVDHRVIVFSGIAGLIADTLSMGASSYLAAVSEKEVYDHEIHLEKQEIELMPKEEEEELAFIYRAKGFAKQVAETLAHEIMKGNKETALQEQVVQELGITGSAQNPKQEGLITGIATLIGALIPLLPLFFGSSLPFIIVAFVVSMTFHFMVGAVRSIFTGRNAVRSGIDMFVVGLGVAVIGYMIGFFLVNTLRH